MKGGEKNIIKKTTYLIGAFVFLFITKTDASTLIANFDSFPEGYTSSVLVDGGITFSESTRPPLSSRFTIDDVSGDDSFLGSLTPPNCLTVGDYIPGPTGGGLRFGSARISFEGIAYEVGIDIFISGSAAQNNQLTLQAFLEDSLVSQTILEVPDITGINQRQMTISDTLFDDLRLVASGPDDYGVVFMSLDNVHIFLVPEPTTLLLLGLGAVMLRRKQPSWHYFY